MKFRNRQNSIKVLKVKMLVRFADVADAGDPVKV